MTELTAADFEVLEFSRTDWQYPHLATMETAISERFGYSLTRYFQRLHFLLDQPESLAYDAQNVNRQRRMRERRRDQRSNRRMIR